MGGGGGERVEGEVVVAGRGEREEVGEREVEVGKGRTKGCEG